MRTKNKTIIINFDKKKVKLKKKQNFYKRVKEKNL